MDKKKINVILNNNYIQKPKSMNTKKSKKSIKSTKSSNELNINIFVNIIINYLKIYLFLKCPIIL